MVANFNVRAAEKQMMQLYASRRIILYLAGAAQLTLHIAFLYAPADNSQLQELLCVGQVTLLYLALSQTVR